MDKAYLELNEALAAVGDTLAILAARLSDLESAGHYMQDGMLAHYLEQAKASDVNVERRVEREPFDFRVVGGNKKRN